MEAVPVLPRFCSWCEPGFSDDKFLLKFLYAEPTRVLTHWHAEVAIETQEGRFGPCLANTVPAYLTLGESKH